MPLVNAPIVGLLLVRTPVELRPKVVTGFMTRRDDGRPVRVHRRRLLLRHVSLDAFFIGLPALLLLGSLAFAAVLLRALGRRAQLEAVAAA